MTKKDILDLISSLPEDKVNVSFDCYFDSHTGGINLMVNAKLDYDFIKNLRGHFFDFDVFENDKARVWF